MRTFNVGILGATGLVGQHLITRLVDHPWFELRGLSASDRSAGRRYADACRWALGPAPPRAVRDSVIRPCSADQLDDCDLVFSALDSSVARKVEPELAAEGAAVVSNSSAFRESEDVPLLVPEVNSGQLALLDRQREKTGGGYIVTNPNCSAAGLAMVLGPLHRSFGVRRVIVTTMQAISGAGLEGHRALDLIDNVVPFIGGEEEKLESELGKILGTMEGTRLRRAELVLSAHCHRVQVLDGHLEAVSMEFDRAAEPAEVAEALRQFRGDVADLQLPSATRPIEVREEPDRPQPRLDRTTGGGMTVVVGRIRSCPVLGTKLELLAHNAVRGAAGATVMNAEILAARDLIPRRATA